VRGAVSVRARARPRTQRVAECVGTVRKFRCAAVSSAFAGVPRVAVRYRVRRVRRAEECAEGTGRRPPRRWPINAACRRRRCRLSTVAASRATRGNKHARTYLPIIFARLLNKS